MKKILIFVTAIVLIFCGSAYAAASKYEYIPFYKYRENMLIEAVINNGKTAEFLIDTGAFGIILSDRFAEEVGADILENELAKVVVANGEFLEGRYAVLKNIALGAVEVNGVKVVVIKEEDFDFSAFDGILGMAFLKLFNFSIDNENNELILERID